MKNTKNTLFTVTLFLTCFTVVSQETSSTSVDIGVDYTSRYVWRGLEFSDSPALQPFAELAAGNLTLGVWASYETGGQTVGQELDWYVSYAIGDFTIGFIDYSFPIDLSSDGYFEFRNHVGEATLSYEGSDTFPLNLMVGVNVYNDDQNSLYTEVGFPVRVGSSELQAFVAGGNELYTTDGSYKITNVGLTATRPIKITDSFSVGAAVSAIFNPDSDDAYLVFTLSLE
jgi:hypothetical protein